LEILKENPETNAFGIELSEFLIEMYSTFADNWKRIRAISEELYNLYDASNPTINHQKKIALERESFDLQADMNRRQDENHPDQQKIKELSQKFRDKVGEKALSELTEKLDQKNTEIIPSGIQSSYKQDLSEVKKSFTQGISIFKDLIEENKSRDNAIETLSNCSLENEEYIAFHSPKEKSVHLVNAFKRMNQINSDQIRLFEANKKLSAEIFALYDRKEIDSQEIAKLQAAIRANQEEVDYLNDTNHHPDQKYIDQQMILHQQMNDIQ